VEVAPSVEAAMAVVFYAGLAVLFLAVAVVQLSGRHRR
jgi:hypothetical protein